MNRYIYIKAVCLFSCLAFSGITASSAIYTTDFTGFKPGENEDFRVDFNVIYGGQDPGVNFSLVDSRQWGITVNGNDFADGIARPQNSPTTLGVGNNANNIKMAGLFLDPSLFPGAGSYTVSFDLTGDENGNAAYRAYVFAGSGYDLTGTEDKRLNLSLSAGGFAGYTGLTATGTGVLASQLLMVDISTQATTAGPSTISFDFTYDGSSAVAVAIGGYNNAATFDNFTVIPEPATYALLAGLVTLGLVIYRRKRI